MNAYQVIFLTLLSTLVAAAQVIMPGKCPEAAVQENFDVEKYLGTWHDIQRLPNAFQKGDCCTATYNLLSPGVISVFNKELLANGTINSITGSAKAKDPTEPAKLQVSFFRSLPPAPYWVLSTDYDSYAVVYSCTNLGLLHVKFAWILAREPTLPVETLQELYTILPSIGVRVDMLLTTNQNVDHCSAMSQ